MTTTERSMPPPNAAERETLDAWLDYYRATLLLICEGIDAEALREASAAPSTLSLQGLLQHLSEVERQWFRRVLAPEELPAIHPGGRTPEGHDGGFDVDPHVPFGTVVGQWQAEVAAARATCAARSLDDTAAFLGAEVSLRWIYSHMIGECARHCGHADILRERIDGATGV
ncbi:DinB family protein [Arthrobacter rhombi]|uniref:DinB family protein n=1 Tax=Arthrobacter rhombi TaxID=71253 RepID=UPI003FD133A0